MIEHVYNFLPTHNERTGCCALPPGVRLDQSDQFTLRGNPYPNINELVALTHQTNYNYRPQLEQLYQTHPAIQGRFSVLGAHNTRMFDTGAGDDAKRGPFYGQRVFNDPKRNVPQPLPQSVARPAPPMQSMGTCCASGLPSMETMSRLWMSGKVMECPQQAAQCLDPYTWNLPDNWNRFYH
jgi:hypothetical protein